VFINIWVNWVVFLISNALLGAAIMMLWKGTMPPPMQHKKASPIASTTLFVVAMTLFTMFGTQDLLQQTISVLTGAK
jgi:hypothetical protein